MSMYANDPRVWAEVDGNFTVLPENAESAFYVVHSADGWEVNADPDTHVWDDNGPIVGCASADHAIFALIGDPQ